MVFNIAYINVWKNINYNQTVTLILIPNPI